MNINNIIFNLLSEDVTTSAEEVTTSSGEKAGDIAQKFVSKETWSDIWAKIVKWLTTTGVKILISVIVIILAMKIINVIYRRRIKSIKKHTEQKAARYRLELARIDDELKIRRTERAEIQKQRRELKPKINKTKEGKEFKAQDEELKDKDDKLRNEINALLLRRDAEKAKLPDATLRIAVVYIVSIIVKVGLISTLCFWVGVEAALITALISIVTLAISLAVQGTLSNIASWLVILVTRPFRVGDFITSKGQSGTVEDVKLFYTTIVTPDNKVIYIPNSLVTGDFVINVSMKETRRCDLVIAIAYDSDVELAKTVILDTVMASEFTLKEPSEKVTPLIEVGNYGDSSIDIYCRSWVKKENYWNQYYKLLNYIKVALDKNNIEIPYNKLDVYVKKD